ncbi:type I methionyl aminopeptidase, partial [Bacillus velezensis]
MIICKTPRELGIMREAGRILAFTHEEIKKHIKPGIST